MVLYSFIILFLTPFVIGEVLKSGDKVVPGLTLKEVERELQEQNRDIERPCAVYDLLCIRRYLAQHSTCHITEGPVPEPLFRLQSNLYFPAFNLSLTQTEIYISGLTGRVIEFYVNKNSDVTVLAVEFRNLTLRSTNATFRYHRRGQEPAVTDSSSLEMFPSLILTTVFKGVNNLRLDNSETTAFISQGIVIIDPSGGVHPDPTIAARFAEFGASPQIYQPEAFLTAGPFYAATYIQYVLCDFGIRLN